MANEIKVEAGTMFLKIDPTGGTNYDTLVCLLSIGKDDSVGEIDASSYCGPDVRPGELSFSRTFEGQHVINPETGTISGTSLRTLLYNKTLVGYEIAPESGVGEVETGDGYITALSSSYAWDAIGTFSGTLKPSGTPTITEES